MEMSVFCTFLDVFMSRIKLCLCCEPGVSGNVALGIAQAKGGPGPAHTLPGTVDVSP